jgi:ribosomal protein S20
LALLLAAVGGVVVRAQTSTPPTTQAPSAPQATPQTPKTNLAQDFWDALASRLHVTITDLQQAVKDATKDTIQKAVQDGWLTQQQADQMKQRVDQWQGNGAPFGFFGGRGFGPKGFGRNGWFGRGAMGARGWFDQGVFDAAAKTLNMTTQDLMTQLRSGKSLADIAKDKGVDEATLKKAMLDAAKADVDTAVSNGRLTQQQADQIKSQLDQMDLNRFLEQPWFHGRGPWFGVPKPRPTPTPGGPST